MFQPYKAILQIYYGGLQLENIAEKIVESSWHAVERSAVQKKFCYCQLTVEESESASLTFIGCHNLKCPYHLWYHTECVERLRKPGEHTEKQKASPDSEELDHATTSLEDKEEEPEIDTLLLDDEEGEFITRRFDLDDLEDVDEELVHIPKSGKKWYCSMQCKLESEDQVLKYMRGIIFTGLLQESFRDSIRQGDGDRILAHAKLQLMRYTHRHHPIYRGIMTR